jgi:hypothetical protein
VRLVAAAPGTAIGTYSGLLVGVQIATPSRRRLALAVDALPLVALLVALALQILPRQGRPSDAEVVVAVVTVLAVVLYCVLHSVLLSVAGRSLGRWLLRLRTVDDLTGEPRGLFSRLGGVRSLRRNTVTVDLTRGRDPLRMPQQASTRSLAVATSGLVSAGPASSGGAGEPAVFEPSPASPSVSLVLDSGERLEVESSVLVGRAPANREGEEHPLFAWPDLGRSLTKTHALLEWSGTVLWVTDMDSTNGSSLVAPDGTLQPLVPGLRGPAAPGYTIRLGERSLEVHPSGVLDSVVTHAQ